MILEEITAFDPDSKPTERDVKLGLGLEGKELALETARAGGLRERLPNQGRSGRRGLDRKVDAAKARLREARLKHEVAQRATCHAQGSAA